MTGILMDKATGEVFLDFDGKPVTAEAVFVPERDDSETGDADTGATAVSYTHLDVYKRQAWDIGAAAGTPVVAADDGTVTVTQKWNGLVTKGDNNSYGHLVQILSLIHI